MAGNHISVRSWPEAVASSRGEIWTSVQHQVKNRIADEITRRNYKRSEEWNVIASELRTALASLLSASGGPFTTQRHLNSDIQSALSWDLLLICLETEFSELLAPMFFVPRLEPIYAEGHFPCGWDGPKLNEGWQGNLPPYRLVIY